MRAVFSKRRTLSEFRASLGRFRPLVSFVAAAWPLLRLVATLYLPAIAAALEPTLGRLELVRLDNGVYLLQDDYKASPETVHTALDVLEAIECRRKIIVMGKVSEPPGSQGPVYREARRAYGTNRRQDHPRRR
jgi:hypothetical protein